jgi:hypothetical protein
MAVLRAGGHGGHVATGDKVSGHGQQVDSARHGRIGAEGVAPLDEVGVGTAVFDLSAAPGETEAAERAAAEFWTALNCVLDTDVEHAARSVTAINVVGTSGFIPRNQRWIDR